MQVKQMASPRFGFTITRKCDATEAACIIRKITKDTKVKPITADEVLKLKAGPKITTHTASNNLARGANAKRIRESEILVSSSNFSKKQAVQMQTKFSRWDLPPDSATNRSMPVRLTSGTEANSEKSRPSSASNQFMPTRLTPAVGAKCVVFSSNQREPARLTSPIGAHSEKSPADFGSNQFKPTKQTSAIGTKSPDAPPASNQCKPVRLTSPTGAHTEKSSPDFSRNQFKPTKQTSAIGTKSPDPPPASNQCKPVRLTSPTGAHTEKSSPDFSRNQFKPTKQTSAIGTKSPDHPPASNQCKPVRLTSPTGAHTEKSSPDFCRNQFMPPKRTSAVGTKSLDPPPASDQCEPVRLTSPTGAHSEKSSPDFRRNQFMPPKGTSAVGTKSLDPPPASDQCEPVRLTSPTGAHSEKSSPDFRRNQFMPPKGTSAVGTKSLDPPPASDQCEPVRLTPPTGAHSEKSSPDFRRNQFMPTKRASAIGTKSPDPTPASNQCEPVRLTSPTGAHTEKSSPDCSRNQFMQTKRTSPIGTKSPDAPSNQCEPVRLTSPTGAHSEKSSPDFSPNQLMTAKSAKPPSGSASNQCEPERLALPTGAYHEKSPLDISSNPLIPERLTSASGANSEKLPARITSAFVANTEECPPGFTPHQFMPARFTSTGENTVKPPPGFASCKFSSARLTSTSGENGRFGEAADAKLSSIDSTPDELDTMCKFSLVRCYIDDSDDEKTNQGSVVIKEEDSTVPADVVKDSSYRTKHQAHNSSPLLPVESPLSGFGAVPLENFTPSNNPEDATISANKVKTSCDGIKQEGNNSGPVLSVTPSLSGFGAVPLEDFTPSNNPEDATISAKKVKTSCDGRQQKGNSSCPVLSVTPSLSGKRNNPEDATISAKKVKTSCDGRKQKGNSSGPVLSVTPSLSGFGAVPLEDFTPSNNLEDATISAKKVKTSCDGIKQKGNNSGPVLSVTPSLSVIKEKDSQMAKPVLQEYPPTGPALEVVWKGNFELLHIQKVRDVPVNVKLCEGFVAHPPAIMPRRAYEFTKQMAGTLLFKLHPRLSIWPEAFHEDLPAMNDVALYLYPGKFERSRKKYSTLLKYLEKNDMAMKSQMGSTELLIFASTLLPLDSQKLKGSFFMWGVFHRSRAR